MTGLKPDLSENKNETDQTEKQNKTSLRNSQITGTNHWFEVMGNVFNMLI